MKWSCVYMVVYRMYNILNIFYTIELFTTLTVFFCFINTKCCLYKVLFALFCSLYMFEFVSEWKSFYVCIIPELTESSILASLRRYLCLQNVKPAVSKRVVHANGVEPQSKLFFKSLFVKVIIHRKW